MDNPEKLETLGTQDKETQQKHKSLLQTTEGKDEPNIVLCRY
jgi:hypothetical protein